MKSDSCFPFDILKKYVFIHIYIYIYIYIYIKRYRYRYNTRFSLKYLPCHLHFACHVPSMLQRAVVGTHLICATGHHVHRQVVMISLKWYQPSPTWGSPCWIHWVNNKPSYYRWDNHGLVTFRVTKGSTPTNQEEALSRFLYRDIHSIYGTYGISFSAGRVRAVRW